MRRGFYVVVLGIPARADNNQNAMEITRRWPRYLGDVKSRQVIRGTGPTLRARVCEFASGRASSRELFGLPPWPGFPNAVPLVDRQRLILRVRTNGTVESLSSGCLWPSFIVESPFLIWQSKNSFLIIVAGLPELGETVFGRPDRMPRLSASATQRGVVERSLSSGLLAPKSHNPSRLPAKVLLPESVPLPIG